MERFSAFQSTKMNRRMVVALLLPHRLIPKQVLVFVFWLEMGFRLLLGANYSVSVSVVLLFSRFGSGTPLGGVTVAVSKSVPAGVRSLDSEGDAYLHQFIQLVTAER
jgi:hypothetical protein